MQKVKLTVFFLLMICHGAVSQAPVDIQDRKPAQQLIDPQLAIKQFQFPAGFKMDLFDSEPMLLNPVQFCFDEQVRIFIAETFRYRKEVYDMRMHMNMYADDIACRTVEDRSAEIKKFLGNK